MNPRTPPPSPALFFETVNAYQRTAAIKAAVELGLFTAVAQGHDTSAALAGAIGAAERGARILADHLVILGFLSKRDGRYALTPDSAMFLDRRSPTYVGGAVEFLLSDSIRGAFDDFAAVVRQGGTTLPESGTLAAHHDVWVRFAQSMAPLMAPTAQAVADRVTRQVTRPMKVLDVSASHGAYGLAFATRNPDARIVGLDWPNVLAVAKENARAAGVADRYSTIEGSAFEADLGGGYDVVLLPNFLHHFDPAACESLLRRMRVALADDGCVATVEFIPNDDRVTPPPAASFALTMLGTTPAGDAYTFAEYQRMFQAAGFTRNELHELPGTASRMILSRK